MITYSILQGTPEWHALRAQHFTASEASAALGLSKYQTRNDLLKQKAFGIVAEEDVGKAYLFAKGHAAEAAARPIVECMLGEDLFPCTGSLEVDGLPLLASFDGITMGEDIIWETKLLNAELLQRVQAGDLEPHYWLQIEQQLLVSGAEKCYFTTTDGTPTNTHGTWYTSVPERRAQLIAGWKQFAKDLAAYVPEVTEAKAVGRVPESLPALRVEVTGMVTSSNLAEFKRVALGAIASVNRDLKTDQDFADSAKARKWCADIESKVKMAKEHALGQTASIDELFKTLDEVAAHAKDTRLELEKEEKKRNVTLKAEILEGGRAAYAAYISACNDLIGRPFMPVIAIDFAAAIKGMSKFENMRNAVDTRLANAKIDADATANKIISNLLYLEGSKAPAFLFADLASLVLKSTDDFSSTVQARTAKHAADELAKLEAQREADRLAELACEAEQAAQQTCAAPVEVIDADGVITKVNTTGAEIEARIAQSPLNAPSPLRTFATAGRPRAATRALVDVVLDTLSESELHRVLTFLQANFAKRAA